MPACGEPTPIVLSPPAIDIEAATEPKPLPPIEIATDPDAAVAYDEAIESWGERLRTAGVRLCLWFVDNGVDVDCGA